MHSFPISIAGIMLPIVKYIDPFKSIDILTMQVRKFWWVSSYTKVQPSVAVCAQIEFIANGWSIERNDPEMRKIIYWNISKIWFHYPWPLSTDSTLILWFSLTTHSHRQSVLFHFCIRYTHSNFVQHLMCPANSRLHLLNQFVERDFYGNANKKISGFITWNTSALSRWGNGSKWGIN